MFDNTNVFNSKQFSKPYINLILLLLRINAPSDFNFESPSILVIWLWERLRTLRLIKIEISFIDLSKLFYALKLKTYETKLIDCYFTLIISIF